MRRLEPTERAEFQIEADKVWNHSGVELVSGRPYRTTVVAGSVEDWRDASLEADPERGVHEPTWTIGNPLARLGLRFRGANYLVLIGCIGENLAGAFVIGSGREILPSRTGELTAFANDWRVAYGNNHGRLTLRIEALAQP